MSRRLLLLPLAGLLLAVPALGAGITVGDPWVRLPPPGMKNTGAFMVLRNPGAAPVKLVRASSPAARVTELHTHLQEGGVMKMRPVESMEVPAHGETVLRPGSLHVMLIDLVAPLAEGALVAVTLVFDDGSSQVVQAQVRKLDLRPAAP